MIRIDRCVCDRIQFAELHDVATEHGCETTEELACHIRFGTRCGSCLPYVAEMLKTGETVFHRLLPRQAVQPK